MLYFCHMEHKKPQYEFSADKNQQLINDRGISFEEVIAAIEEGAMLDVISQIYVINMNNYICLVPFVRKDESTVFLKTIFPHRKLTKQYLRGDKDEKTKA